MAYKTYKSFKELNGKTLKYGDTVIFRDIRYEVRHSFLHARMNHNNAVFDQKLDLEDDQTEDILSDFYGYPHSNGQWPECKIRDYEALTRACLGIYALLDKDPYIDFKMKDGSYRRVDLSSRKASTRIRLNTDHVAVLTKSYVKVGCQSIKYNALQVLVDTAKAQGFIK